MVIENKICKEKLEEKSFLSLERYHIPKAEADCYVTNKTQAFKSVVAEDYELWENKIEESPGKQSKKKKSEMKIRRKMMTNTQCMKSNL